MPAFRRAQCLVKRICMCPHGHGKGVFGMKTLVVYYSRKGTTNAAAELAAAELGADLEEIVEIKSHAGIIGFLKAGHEALTGETASIAPLKYSAAEYDLVVVASPIWAGHTCSPVNAYLAAAGGQIARLGVILTHMDRKNDYRSAAESIGQRCGKPVLALLSVTGKPGAEEVRRFAGELREAAGL